MPGISDFHCCACGHKRSTTFWLEYQLDDGSMVVLPHPGEDEAISEHGTTLERARDQLRLYQGSDWACHNCGRLCTHLVQIVPGSARWTPRHTRVILWVEIVALTACAAYELLFGSTHLYAWLCPMLSVIGISIVGLALVETRADRARWQGRWAPSSPAACPSCGSDEIWLPEEVVQGWKNTGERTGKDVPSESLHRRLVCERCGKAQLACSGFGIS